MNEAFILIVVFISGLILGILFFGGLWLTVKKAVTSKMPTLLFLGSFFFRIAITMIGFYYITFGDWKRLIVAVSGFVLVRYIVVYLTKSNEKKHTEIKEGGGDQ